MDTPTTDFQRGAIRVSDAERDQAVAELHLGWLVPVIVLGFVFLRLSRHR